MWMDTSADSCSFTFSPSPALFKRSDNANPTLSTALSCSHQDDIDRSVHGQHLRGRERICDNKNICADLSSHDFNTSHHQINSNPASSVSDTKSVNTDISRWEKFDGVTRLGEFEQRSATAAGPVQLAARIRRTDGVDHLVPVSPANQTFMLMASDSESSEAELTGDLEQSSEDSPYSVTSKSCSESPMAGLKSRTLSDATHHNIRGFKPPRMLMNSSDVLQCRSDSRSASKCFKPPSASCSGATIASSEVSYVYAADTILLLELLGIMKQLFVVSD